MKKIVLSVCVAMMSLSVLATEQNPLDANELTPAEKVYGLSLFWQEVNYNFVYFDQVPDLNWDSAFQAYIPQVLATTTDYDYYRVLQRFAALLRDGHTDVKLPRHYWDGLDRPKIALLEVQGRIYIDHVDTSLKETIPIGSELLAVDGISTPEYLQEEVFPYNASSTDYWLWHWSAYGMLRARRNTEVEITFRTPEGKTVTRRLLCNRDGLEWYPPLQEDGGMSEFRWLEDDIAYVALNSFNNREIVAEFADYLSDLQRAKAIVIDLRENGGGSTGNGALILSHFSTDTLVGSTWRTREHRGAYKAWGKSDTLGTQGTRPYYEGNAWYEGTPYKHPPADSIFFTCPVAVLVSHQTGSAAEDFLIMCDPLDNFTIVGEPSNGSTGQPVVFDLPGGGWARVCAKRDSYADGRDFVGVGVQPDILIEPSIDDVLQDRDVVLNRAVEYLKTKQ